MSSLVIHNHNMKIFIIIPTYNEKENLERLVQEIFSLGIEGLNLVVVDDNSPDKTGLLAKNLAKKYPIFLIERQKKMGLGSAYRTGFQFALENKADLIFEMDADGSHQAKEIPKFLEAISEGAEVVIGSRRIPEGKIIGWNLWRRFCSWAATNFSRLILGLKTKDVTSGFRCYRNSVLKSLLSKEIKSEGYAWQEETIWLCEKMGFKIKEIPITFINRKFGQSKLGLSEILEFFLIILKLKLSKRQ